MGCQPTSPYCDYYGRQWPLGHPTGAARTAGHKAGAETFRRIATYCKNIGVKYLTVYAFSTENWKRSETEVSAIMALLKKYLLEAVDTMERDHIRLHFFGDMTPIAPELRALAHETDEITEHLSKDDFQANVCLNYGGRDEILRAVRRFAAECAEGKRKPEDLDETLFSTYLDSAGIPDPELIIRPSGEQRLSNFLLWQCAYSEFYYTDTLWPDFDEGGAGQGNRRLPEPGSPVRRCEEISPYRC